MAYDPTAETGIPTEPVGSLPGPTSCRPPMPTTTRARSTRTQLETRAGRGRRRTRSSAWRRPASPIVSDGEQRWSSFATYPVDRHAGRHRPRRHLGPGGQYFAIFADGHHRQLPRSTGGPFRYKTFAADTLSEVDQVRHQADEAGGDRAVDAGAAVSARRARSRATRGSSSRTTWSTNARRTSAARSTPGAARVSIDFTEGRLAWRDDPRNPWTGRGMLPHFIELINRVLDRFTPEERANIGIHTCPGGDRDSVHSADVPYSELLPSMFEMNAGYFLIQLAQRAGQGARLQADRRAQPRRRERRAAGGLHRRDQSAEPAGRSLRRRSATSWSRPPSTSPRSGSARPTTAASRRSASTRSRSTARPTTRATSRSRRSRTAWRARGWRPRSSASTCPLPRRRLTHGLAAT